MNRSLKCFRAFVVSIFISPIFFFAGCNTTPETLFVLLPADKTGVEFTNTIFESDSFNIFNYDYIYNGGGVAVADFNNDGLQDIFFTGNMVPNKLYLNKGKMSFEDVSEAANVNVKGRWNSGATIVDINNDGWQDIYVCATKINDSTARRNMLFLNKGVNQDNTPEFAEVASQYGIDDNGYSVMASFFDYDRDGDLDLYVLTNMQLGAASSTYRPKVVDGSSPSNDRLYKNNGNGTFTNVTKEAGIVFEGFGLGLAISDFNLDGWSDIYVSNDFVTNDLLYINNQDGTFTNKSPQLIGHQSLSSMGNDAADFNNDGLPDVITTEMLPETNDRKKTFVNNKSYTNYINTERFHYEYQYVRNMLHYNNGLNNGIGFSEIGQLSGVHQTEWSWSALFADFDNDGMKDLVITNGFPKDITDKDFMSYRTEVGAFMSTSDLLDSVPVVKIPNYAYKNNGDLTFKDVSKEWGFTQPSFSNGAAFADLDNDGDLDYVINNINDKAFIYENRIESRKDKSAEHYLRIKLTGPATNRNAIGTKVELYTPNGGIQMLEHYVTRGYLSSVEDVLHFGLGQSEKIDSVLVTWPDGNIQKFDRLKIDAVDTISYDPSKFIHPSGKPQRKKLFTEVSGEINLLFRHEEEDKIDFNLQRTLPHKFSQSGPGIAVGDITGDGLDDIIVGGSVGHYFTTFTQENSGSFSRREFPAKPLEKKEEDEGLLLFDADGDNDLDLYIVSGGIESPPDAKDYYDHLYKNNGRGQFKIDTTALPRINASGSCVRAADIDGDNDLDLFIGGRTIPGSYPYPAASYILRNDNGMFVDVTESVCPAIKNLGMITDALLTDFDNDGKTDIVVAGEFLPITFFKNVDGRFNRLDSTGVEGNVGWWNSIAGGDFDNDGDTDYVAGNLGLNNAYQVTADLPLCVFAKDFDKNGSVDPVLACYIKKSLSNEEKDLFPIHFWDELNSQSPKFRQQFSKYKQYSRASVQALLNKEELADALILRANHMESSYIENLGGGKFKMRVLPVMAQVAPVNGQVVDDVNDDGNLDVLMVGNDFGNEVFAGRYDAFTGLVLLGDGRGNFKANTSSQNGFYVVGDAKGLSRVSGVKGDLYVATRNRESLVAFAVDAPKTDRAIEPKATDSWAELVYHDGKKRKVEFYHGCGYLSQSTRKLKWNAGIKSVVFHGFDGRSRQLE